MSIKKYIEAKCTLVFNVSNIAYHHMKDKISFNDFTQILEQRSGGNIKVTRCYWNKDTILDVKERIYPSMIYEMKIDPFNIIKNNYNKFVAEVFKLIQNKRDDIILQKLHEEIKKGFEEKLKEQVYSSLDITLKSITLTKT
jgi:hypothetical protein